MKDHLQDTGLTKEDVTVLITAAKKSLGQTWEGTAAAIDMSPVWTHSACMGMNAMPGHKADALVKTLDFPTEASAVLQECLTKTWSQTAPTDPYNYRLYEIVGVHGPKIKALIHKEFGDGIMFAIDFDMQISRIPHEKGDRVKVEMSDKYPGYNAW